MHIVIFTMDGDTLSRLGFITVSYLPYFSIRGEIKGLSYGEGYIKTLDGSHEDPRSLAKISLDRRASSCDLFSL